MGEQRIEYFKEFLSKPSFEKNMIKGTHIIAPINASGYKYGKDTGAIYDVFKYNKIGIFNHSYYYNDNLIEKDVIFSYTNLKELHTLLYDIISEKISY